MGRIAWYGRNCGRQTHEVGQKLPNAFGLYDMSGNVWEWCQSLYKSYLCPADEGREDLSSGGPRVFRGGSWVSVAKGCWSTFRSKLDPSLTFFDSGFRVAVSPPPQE